ncbi:MAG: HAMP domain-containing protein [Verrucomicrobiales bacterium]|nr:HAMP domain-containing protein [Verrucomicrobiales bacterium]
MTIPRRIVLHVALGVGVVIAVVTAVTYWMVYQAVKQRDLQHLNAYVSERSLREEQTFRQVEGNLRLVRGQFLKRMRGASPSARDIQEKWNARFRLFPDGAWRSQEKFQDGRRYSTLWAHRDFDINLTHQLQILRAQDICDELLPGWADTFPSVYFVLPGWANIGFDPRIPSWVWDTPADYDATELEWFQLALPRNQVATGLSWTGVLEEPTTKMPMVSVYIPMELDGTFLGSIGHDIDVSRMMDEATRSGLTGVTHLIFRSDGRLIAHPTRRAEIIATKGRLRMQECGEPALASLYRAVSSVGEQRFSGYDSVSEVYYSVARLSGPDWLFLTMMPRAQLHQQAFASAQWVVWSGLVSLSLVLVCLGAVLRRQISRPLMELTLATRQMSRGNPTARARVRRNDELGDLAQTFNEMASQVAARESELRQLNLELENRVAVRTADLTQANQELDQAREEALRLLARERELGELKSDFVSLVSHEFRTPLEIILSSTDNLQRYHDRLLPEKRQQLLGTIQKAVRRMADMMEEVLVLGRLQTDRVTFRPAALDLRSLCRRLCDEVDSATNGRCPIRLELDGVPETVVADEGLLRHIFNNLLGNAVKYSPASEPVMFHLRKQGDRVVCEVRDRGCGIPEADQKRVFQAFHRGSNVRQIPGTGLGLMIVQRCVALHGGEIQFESTEGQGSTFTVALPLFAPESKPDENHTGDRR